MKLFLEKHAHMMELEYVLKIYRVKLHQWLVLRSTGEQSHKKCGVSRTWGFNHRIDCDVLLPCTIYILSVIYWCVDSVRPGLLIFYIVIVSFQMFLPTQQGYELMIVRQHMQLAHQPIWKGRLVLLKQKTPMWVNTTSSEIQVLAGTQLAIFCHLRAWFMYIIKQVRTLRNQHTAMTLL